MNTDLSTRNQYITDQCKIKCYYLLSDINDDTLFMQLNLQTNCNKTKNKHKLEIVQPRVYTSSLTRLFTLHVHII